MQELKSTDADFPVAAFEKAGYGAVWRGQKTWNGVAILARDAEPVLTRSALPGDAADTQSRYIEAAVNGILIASLYAAERQSAAGAEIRLQAGLVRAPDRARRPAAEAGCAGRAGGRLQRRTDRLDIYPTKSWDKDALIQPESRAAFQMLLEQGWTDAIRTPPSVKADVHVLGLHAQPLGRATPACGSIICC